MTTGREPGRRIASGRIFGPLLRQPPGSSRIFFPATLPISSGPAPAIARPAHSDLLDRFGEADADFVFYGHSDHQLVQHLGTVLVINPARPATRATTVRPAIELCGARHRDRVVSDFPDRTIVIREI